MLAATLMPTHCHASGHLKLQVGYGAAISACEKGSEWNCALELVCCMAVAALVPNTTCSLPVFTGEALLTSVPAKELKLVDPDRSLLSKQPVSCSTPCVRNKAATRRSLRARRASAGCKLSRCLRLGGLPWKIENRQTLDFRRWRPCRSSVPRLDIALWPLRPHGRSTSRKISSNHASAISH